MSDEKRKYEAVIVLNIKGDDGVDKLVKNVEKEMEGEGAKMDRIDQLGKKEFAYNARKQASGFYVNYYFEAAPNTITKIKEKLDLNSDIYLQHYQLAS